MAKRKSFLKIVLGLTYFSLNLTKAGQWDVLDQSILYASEPPLGVIDRGYFLPYNYNFDNHVARVRALVISPLASRLSQLSQLPEEVIYNLLQYELYPRLNEYIDRLIYQSEMLSPTVIVEVTHNENHQPENEYSFSIYIQEGAFYYDSLCLTDLNINIDQYLNRNE